MFSQDLPTIEKPLSSNQKRKRSQEAEDPLSQTGDGPSQKRPRTLLDTSNQKANRDTSKTQFVDYWTLEGSWPEKYFELDANMNQQLCSMSYTQGVREDKNPPVYSPEYDNVLEKAGIFVSQQLSWSNISDTSKKLCAEMLDGEVCLTNKARVLRDITPSIVPSAELHYIRGASDLQHLAEEISTEWTKCICIAAGPRAKPDYAVGLKLSVFSDDEIEKLMYYTAYRKPKSFTRNMYFPFLVCEVKSGEEGLNPADRQNAHSASIAAGAIVELYRDQAVPRAKDLHQKITVFSISHNHTMVKIYDHYALVDGDKTTFYRHLIHSFDLNNANGKERWTAYRFVRKVYETFVPTHLERIRSAIAQLPDSSIDNESMLEKQNAKLVEQIALSNARIDQQAEQTAQLIQTSASPLRQFDLLTQKLT